MALISRLKENDLRMGLFRDEPLSAADAACLTFAATQSGDRDLLLKLERLEATRKQNLEREAKLLEERERQERQERQEREKQQQVEKVPCPPTRMQELTDAKAILMTQDKELAALRMKSEGISGALERVEGEKIALEGRIRTLEEDRNKCEADKTVGINAIRRTLASVQADLQKAQTDLLAKNELAQSLEREKGNLNARIQELEQNARTDTQTQQALTSERDEARQARLELETKYQQTTETQQQKWETEAKKKEAERDRLREALEVVRQSLTTTASGKADAEAAFEKEVSRCADEQRKFVEESESFGAQLQEAKDKLTRATASCEEHVQRLEKLQIQNSAEIARLTATLTERGQETTSKETAAQEDIVRQKEAVQASLKEKIEELHLIQTTLNEKVASLNACEESRAVVDEEHKRILKAEVARLKANCGAKKAEALVRFEQELSENNEKWRQQFSEKNSLQVAELSKLQATLQEKTINLSTCETNAAESAKSHSRLLEQERKKLKETYRQRLEQEHKAGEDKVAAANTACRKTREQLLKDNGTEVDTLSAAKKALQTQLTRTSENADKLAAKIQGTQRELEALQSRETVMQQQLEDQSRALSAATRSSAVAQRTHDELIAELEAEKRTQTEDLAKQTADIDELNDLLGVAHERITSLEERVTTLEKRCLLRGLQGGGSQWQALTETRDDKEPGYFLQIAWPAAEWTKTLTHGAIANTLVLGDREVFFDEKFQGNATIFHRGYVGAMKHLFELVQARIHQNEIVFGTEHGQPLLREWLLPQREEGYYIPEKKNYCAVQGFDSIHSLIKLPKGDLERFRELPVLSRCNDVIVVKTNVIQNHLVYMPVENAIWNYHPETPASEQKENSETAVIWPLQSRYGYFASHVELGGAAKNFPGTQIIAGVRQQMNLVEFFEQELQSWKTDREFHTSVQDLALLTPFVNTSKQVIEGFPYASIRPLGVDFTGIVQQGPVLTVASVVHVFGIGRRMFEIDEHDSRVTCKYNTRSWTYREVEAVEFNGTLGPHIVEIRWCLELAFRYPFIGRAALYMMVRFAISLVHQRALEPTAANKPDFIEQLISLDVFFPYIIRIALYQTIEAAPIGQVPTFTFETYIEPRNKVSFLLPRFDTANSREQNFVQSDEITNFIKLWSGVGVHLDTGDRVWRLDIAQ